MNVSFGLEVDEASARDVPRGHIFKIRSSTRNTRFANSDKLCQPVPGHQEAASNKLSQIWNILNLSSAKTLGSVRTLARSWFKENGQSLIRNS